MVTEIILHICLVIYIAASAGLLVYGLNSYVMVAMMAWFGPRQRRRDLAVSAAFDVADGNLPVVTTQLPIYNEKHVVLRLLRAVCAMDYPRDRHEIQVLDDSTDETTQLVAAEIEALRAAGHDIRHLRRKHRKGYKAGALAAGLESAKGEFIAIFDADFVPPPDFLRRTVPFLLHDERCCFVQTRWGHRNRRFSLLTELQGIGIDGHFVVEQAARAAGGLVFNFNGTAGIWRAAAIADAGGWKADTLTEDLDLSYRAVLRGWRPHYLPDFVTPAELPTDINALKSQQSRWATGSIQCAIKMLPRLLRESHLGPFVKIQAVLHLTQYLIHPLILILTILILPLILLGGVGFASSLSVPLLGVVLVAMFGPSLLYVVSQLVSGQQWRRAIMLMPLLIAIGIGLAVNNSLAVLRALRGGQNREFVRTPKLGAGAEVPPASGRTGAALAVGDYRPAKNRTHIAELVLGVWATTSCIAIVTTIGPGGGLLTGLQALAFLSVGTLSLRHRRRPHFVVPGLKSP